MIEKRKTRWINSCRFFFILISLYDYETGEFEADIVENEDLHYLNIWTTIILSDNIILDEQYFENFEGDETHVSSCKTKHRNNFSLL